MLSLRELQSSFFSSLARRPGAGCANFASRLVQCVVEHGLLGSAERIDIYVQLYYARLFDVLRGDFPRVATVLGCERFDDVVRAYLARHPSTNPSLRHLGRHFATFLTTRAEAASLPFLSDLARLEWARVEVFDAPDAEPLRLEHLQGIAPDEWPELRFHLIPALQVVQSDWPVPEIWAAAEKKTPAPTCIQRGKTTVRVWRDGFAVYHAKMDESEQVALDGMQAGESFAVACATLESLLPAEEAAPIMGSLLLRWIEDGILARLP